MINHLKAILFDFDGVLADTEPLHWRCWSDTLAPLGVSISWENYQAHCVGISDREFLEQLGRISTPPRTLDELWPTYPLKKKLFRERATSGGLVTAEVKKLLNEVKHHPLAVVTSSSRTEIEPILQKEEILSYFGAAVYGDEVANLKPHPEPYLTALNRLGTTQGIVLEDSGPGKESARAAGCELIEVERASDVPRLLRQHLGLK